MAGVVGIQQPLVILARINADCSAGRDYTVNRAGTVIDVRLTSNVAVGGSNISVRNVATTITGGLSTATDMQVVRAATLDNAQVTFAAGGTMNFIGSVAGALGDVAVLYLPPVAYAETQV